MFWKSAIKFKMAPMSTDFTIAAYRTLLEAASGAGYGVADFDNIDPEARQIVLRHDVDFWPEASLPLADVEHSLGLSAWYFFLVRSDAYTIASPNTVAVLKRLRQLGHRIGLHFDTSLFPDDPVVLNDEARWECDVLEHISAGPVDCVSFHRPAPYLLNSEDLIAGRIHAYQPRFFRDIGYVSDSRGAWRHGHPLDSPAFRDRRAFQLLTHPIWWATDCAGDREAALVQYERDRARKIRGVLAETVTGYDANHGSIDGEV